MSNPPRVIVSLFSSIAARIAAHLKQFRLDDLLVVGKTRVLSDARLPEVLQLAETGPVTISELCAESRHWHEHSVPRNRSSYEHVEYPLKVCVGDVVVGTIDSNQIFSYREADDVRTCLGYLVATDLGRWQPVDRYDLDAATATISEAVRQLRSLSGLHSGHIEREFSEGAFGQAVRDHLKKDYGSHLLGGVTLEGKNALWQVATRTLLGQEHPGFTYPE